MDRFELPWLGRRRGWLVLTQLALVAMLLALASSAPKEGIRLFALLAVMVAFLSASQDVVVDAYRTDLLPAAERGMGASLGVMGYRLAMILSGGIALIWTDVSGGWTWPEVYRFMAFVMVGAALLSATLLPRLPTLDTGNLPPSPQGSAAQDLRGFAAVLLAVAVGVWLSDRFGPLLAQALLGPWLEGGGCRRCCKSAGSIWWPS